MPYLDTSLLVAALTREKRTTAVQNWLSEQEPERLLISDWVATEFSAALSMKVRRQELGECPRADVMSAFTALMHDTLTVLPVTRDDFRAAAQFANNHASGLPAGDALHLAVVANRGLQLVSLDRVMVKAAIRMGISASLF